MEDFKIRDLDHYLSLWTAIHESDGPPQWDHMLPYYDKEIHFQDTVQTIRGFDDFKAMTDRLSKRSKNLTMIIHNASQSEDLFFVEWEMVISFKKFPSTSIHGTSRTLIKDGKIIDQRDYYDLWGDIFTNIPLLGRGYRRFMRKRFG